MTVSFDISAVRRAAARLGAAQKELTTLEKRAVSTLRRRMDVEARRDILTELTVPANRLREGLSTRAVDGGVDVVGSGRGIGLVNYEGEWGGRSSAGATARVIRGGARQVERGAFIATLPNGARQIVGRYGPKVTARKGRYAGQKRQRIRVEYGPSVARMLTYGQRISRLNRVADEVLTNETARLLALL